MKIRKLILKAKLQQIQKQYHYVFIYHCSGLTNRQWRQLKDFLYKTNSKTFFQPKRRQKQPLYSEAAQREARAQHFMNNQSTALQQNFINKNASGAEGTNWGAPSDEPGVNSKLAFLSGPFCVFYIKSQGSFRGRQSNASWSDVLKKIDSLDYKTNIVLLYAQIKSTLLNHMDIKEALNLETQSVYQQLLSSTLFPVQSLDFCLYQKRNTVLSILDAQECVK